MGDKGHMLITIDQGKFMDRYQGIVALEGETLSEAAVEYFRASEQLPSRVRIVCQRDESGKWGGAAIMIQHLARNTDLERVRTREDAAEAEHWQNACVLMDSVTDKELLDNSLSLQDLLFRLFSRRRGAGIRSGAHGQRLPLFRGQTASGAGQFQYR